MKAILMVSKHNIARLVDVYLRSTFFNSYGEFYGKSRHVVMGLSFYLIVENIFMEYFGISSDSCILSNQKFG